MGKDKKDEVVVEMREETVKEKILRHREELKKWYEQQLEGYDRVLEVIDRLDGFLSDDDIQAILTISKLA